MENKSESAATVAEETNKPESSLTCFDGHPLVLGEARGGSGTYNCNKCRAHYTSQSSSWRCQEDFRRGGGNCNFDLCVNCVKNLGVEHCAAWLVTRRLALMITVNRPSGMYPEETANPDPPPSEEDSENFKRLLKPIPAYLVDQIRYDNIGNLLHYAVTWNQTGYLQILLDHGMNPLADQAFPAPYFSPLDEALIRCHMEVWKLLKGHIEMTVQMKLSQLHQMLRRMAKMETRKIGETDLLDEFKELLTSLPVEMVKPFPIDARDSPEKTKTLLQLAAQFANKDAVLLLLEHGVDPKEICFDERPPIKYATDMDVAEILAEAIGDEGDVKLELLSKTMYLEDQETAKVKFREILSSLSPELVGRTSVNEYGSVLQDATIENKTDFIRILLEHGVDPTANTDTRETSAVAMAAEKDSEFRKSELLTLFAQYVELPADIKIQHLKSLIEKDNFEIFEDDDDQKKMASLDLFKKQLESLEKDVDKVQSARIRVEWLPDFEYREANFLQYLAAEERDGKLELFELLLNYYSSHGVDLTAATEEVTETPLEIAASNKNAKAFDLLAPHYGENDRKKIAQLMIWALMDKAPSPAFMLLFESIPLAEVNNQAILGLNLLQTLALKGESAHLAFLLERGVDAEARSDSPRCAMSLAWLKDHVESMAELAKYTEPDEEVASSSVWMLVQTKKERSWQNEMLSLMRRQQKQMDEQQKQIEKQSKLLALIAKASGIKVDDVED